MFKGVIRFFAKRGYVLILSACLLLLIGLLFNLKGSDHQDIQKFQRVFLSQTTKAKKQLDAIPGDWKKLDKGAFSKKYNNLENTLFIHVYHGDSLVFWNTNKCPVNRFTDLHFPTNGVAQLQNGWYYTQFKKEEDKIFAVTFGIKRVFPITNDQLKDYFFKPFPVIHGTVSLVTDKDNGIFDKKGEAIFGIHRTGQSPDNHSILTIIFADLLIIVLLLSFKINGILKTNPTRLAYIFAVLVVRYLALRFDWFEWMENTSLFDPGLMALNNWLPNFGEVLVWLVSLLIIFPPLSKVILSQSGKVVSYFLLLLIPVLMMLYPQIIKLIIVNSTIPINLSEILKLNIFSIVFIFILGLSSLFIIRFYQHVIGRWRLMNPNGIEVLIVLFALFGSVVIANEWVFRLHGFWIIWMFSLLIISLIVVFRFKQTWSFTFYLLATFLVSFGITMNLEMEAKKKEREERLLFANQLADDRDFNAEVDFTKAKEKMISEPFLKRLFRHDTKPSFSELKEAMEYQVFKGYWDRYDVDFYYYLEDSAGLRLNGMYKKQLSELIERHGVRSEIDTSLYYVKDYTSQFNYVLHLPLERNGVKADFYGTMKSKRIPEKIGFPRLLISKQTAVFESLERYSIAKYYNDQLVLNYGAYSYPTDLNIFIDQNDGKGHQWFEKDGFEHLIFRKSETDAIILSKTIPSWLSYLTTTSILLVCFGAMFALVLLLRRLHELRVSNGISMITKIQLVLIGLIVISLCGFSIASTTMLSGQYRSYSTDQIREKVKSVINEINSRQRFISEKFSDKNQDELDYQLRRWSKVFQTDINLYQADGILAGTSRTKIYNMGLLSEQMNPKALYELQFDKRSEFIHEENIGSLVYLSGYVPVFNHENELLGYLNVLHFDQRNVFEDQLRQFFVAILNVFMLLLVLSILVALLVSSWLTGPLMLLRKSFSQFELGKNSLQINYKAHDEIGSLVAEYNHKLNELAEAAAKLAQSERESAWREMAKQVAHEIKNPLTPMKLSVQHLQRVFDPNDPKSAERIERVTNSLIEQIDALTHIANEFSNFAKLPQPVIAEIDLLSLLKAVAALFDGDGNVHVALELNSSEAIYVPGDKEMLLRVLNNLVSNGIQAVSMNTVAQIVISLDAIDDFVFVRVKDNGTGIPKDQIQTIFEPYFTTKSTGTGLGLAMVKQIVETHQGSIVIEETSPAGTTVLVSLPRLKKQ